MRKYFCPILIAAILAFVPLAIWAEETTSTKKGNRVSYGMISVPVAMEAHNLEITLNKQAKGFAIYPAKIERGYLKTARDTPIISGKSSTKLHHILSSGIYALAVEGSSGAVANLTYELRKEKKVSVELEINLGE